MNSYDVYVSWWVSGGCVLTCLTVQATSMKSAIAIAESYQQVASVKGATVSGYS